MPTTRPIRTAPAHPLPFALCFPPHPPLFRRVVPHHPSSFSLSDRTGAFQESVHCSRPVEGPFPLFQLRNHDSGCFVTQLDLLYTPFTWSTPLHFDGACKVHHVIHLTGDIPHVTSDHARKGDRQLRQPLLPAPSPDSGPSRPPGTKPTHSGRGYAPVAPPRQWHKMAHSKLRLVPADRTRPGHVPSSGVRVRHPVDVV